MEKMITDHDITKLKDVFVTKEEFFALSDRVGVVDGKVEVLSDKVEVLSGKVEVLDEKVEVLTNKMELLDDKVEVLGEKMDYMTVTMDRIAGNYDTMVVENAVGADVLARHTRQIDVLAKTTGTKLPD